MASLKGKLSIDQNQPIFIGIVVHKSKCSVCFIHLDEVIGNFTIAGEVEALEKLLKRHSSCQLFAGV